MEKAKYQQGELSYRVIYRKPFIKKERGASL